MTYDAHTSLKAANLLDNAAAHMTKVGHTKGIIVETGDFQTQPVCMIGAVRIAAGVVEDCLYDDHQKMPRTVREAECWLAEKVIDAGGKTIYDGDDIEYVETVGAWNDADNFDLDSATAMLRDTATAIRKHLAKQPGGSR